MSWPGKDTSDINDRRKTRRLAKPRSALEPFSLRAQTFWKPPSVFSNPFKPVIPLNAPPIEPLLRVGRFMPTVTMGIRTATEMAQLEEEVYRLRNMVIDRIRECPYSDCRRQFQNGDNDALDVHLQEEHTSLRCPYCVATHTWEKGSGSELYHKSADSAMQHFLQYHRDDMMSKFGIDTTGHDSVDNGIPGIVLANDKIQRTTGTYRFCDQCGRNHNLCFREEDRQNHRNKCYRLNDDDTDEVLQQYRSQRFCQYCGVASGVRCSNAQNCPSGDGSPEPAPIISCYLCGFDFSNSGDLCRREHREGCRPLCGRSRDFCGFCGCDFKDRTLVDKLNHAKFCEERPKPRKVKCPSCWEELETPEDAIFHVEEDHGAPTVCLWCDQTFPTDDTAWGPEVKVQHFAFHMGSYPQVRGAHSGTKVRQGQEKCPAFNICGVVVGQMSRDQYLQHWKQAHDTSVDLSGVKGYHPNGQRIKRPQGLVDEAMELDKQSDCHSIKGASSPREGEKIRNCVPIEGEYKWSFDTHARAASPDWDQVLGTKMSGNGQKFRPGESMRCSRCFKPAPSAQHPNYDYEVEVSITNEPL